MPDFPELSYGTVHGRFLAGLLDAPHVVNPLSTSAPNAEPLSGSVVFAATASVILVDQSLPEPVTFMPQPLRVHLDDEGYLSLNGSRDVNLWATDDPSGNPVDWQWHVHFELHLNGRGVYRQPFNFELPAGTTVDLTTVAPLVVLDDGTIIIRGPAGVDGVDGGVKVYPDRAAVDAVRETEVGLWHIENLALEFPNLAAVGSGTDAAFAAQGPADVMVFTVKSSSTNPNYSPLFFQHFEVPNAWDAPFEVERTWYGPNGKPPSTFYGVRNIPSSDAGMSSYVLGTLPSTEPYYTKGAYQRINFGDKAAYSNGYLIRRNPTDGTAEIVDPIDPLDIANKQYVDAAVAGGGGGGGGALKVYADKAEMMMERTGTVGVLRVPNISEAFPELAIAAYWPWSSTGPGEFVVTTQIGEVSGSPTLFDVIQTMSWADGSSANPSGAQRIFRWQAGQPDSSAQWKLIPIVPTKVDEAVIFGSSGAPNWTTKRANNLYVPYQNAVMIRQLVSGTAEIADPVNPLDIVNKRTLDAAIAALRTELGLP